MLWKVLHFYSANVILASCFTLRGHDTYLFTVVIVSGRQDLPSDTSAFFSLLKRKAFLLRLNKGYNFPQSAFWI